MAIWPFNRRKNQDQAVPPEVQEYYQSERRERVGMAWLLAALSLVATVLVVLGLYFGGKWIWNKITDDNDTTTTQNDTPQEQQPADTGEPQPSDIEQPSDTDSQSPDTPTTSDEDVTPDSQSTDSDQNTSSQEDNLASTGPRETVAAFIGVTILGALVHNIYSRRKLVRN